MHLGVYHAFRGLSCTNAYLVRLCRRLSLMQTCAGTAKVMSSVPYYSAYPSNAQYPASRYFEWYDGPTEQLNTSRDSVIEIVTAPNNPDGAMKNQTVPGAQC